MRAFGAFLFVLCAGTALSRNPYSGLDLTSYQNKNPLFEKSVHATNCSENIQNTHTAYWIDTTFALERFRQYIRLLSSGIQVLSIVFSMFPEKAFFIDGSNQEVCCQFSCSLEESVHYEEANDCVFGVVDYKNRLYQLRNILMDYPNLNKVIFIEPNTFGLVSGKRFSRHYDTKQIKTIVEGYVNSLSYALSVFSQVPNVTLYIDGGQSLFTNVSILSRNYQALFSGKTNVTLHSGDTIEFRYYKNVPPLDISHVNGFTIDIRGYPSSVDTSLAYMQLLHNEFPTHSFVIDTSIVSLLPYPENTLWYNYICNGKNTRIGIASSSDLNVSDVDAFLWITSAALSDGRPTKQQEACTLNTSFTEEAANIPFVNLYSPFLLEQRCNAYHPGTEPNNR